VTTQIAGQKFDQVDVARHRLDVGSEGFAGAETYRRRGETTA